KRFLVGFEARWLIDNVISSKCNLNASLQSIVKLSKDRLIVQGQYVLQVTDDENNNQIISNRSTICSVRSAFSVSSGASYYYECIILTSGFMSIGWTSKQSELGEWR